MAAAIPIAGAALSAYGAIQQGNMTSDSLNEQARNLTAQAQEAEQKGQYDAMRQQLISGQKIGTSIAAYGASGVSAESGSVLDVVQFSHQNAELDRLNILHGADVRAINYENQASMNRYGADSARLGSYWRALGAMTMGMTHVDTGGAKPGSGGSGGGSSGGGEGAALGDGAAEGGAAAGADTGAEVAAMA